MENIRKNRLLLTEAMCQTFSFEATGRSRENPRNLDSSVEEAFQVLLTLVGALFFTILLGQNKRKTGASARRRRCFNRH